jgi:hypothetical protein
MSSTIKINRLRRKLSKLKKRIDKLNTTSTLWRPEQVWNDTKLWIDKNIWNEVEQVIVKTPDWVWWMFTGIIVVIIGYLVIKT